MTKKLVVLLALALASAIPACGGSDETSTAPKHKPEVIEIEADPSGRLAYTLGGILVQEGGVIIHFKNPQKVEHDVAVEDPDGNTIGQTDRVAKGRAATEIIVQPGTYHYYCTVPGHRRLGMEGELLVETY